MPYMISSQPVTDGVSLLVSKEKADLHQFDICW